jgi:RNA polymerase sigma-70 factor (ECF subfamily)
MAATSDTTDLRTTLEAAVDRARRRWPGIGCGPGELAAHVEQLGTTVGDLDRFGDELHLACASCHFDAAALRILDRDYILRSARTLLRLRAGADFNDEAIQQLRHKLLLPPEPRLSRYAATGPLLAWVRMVVLRLGLDIRRNTRNPEDADLADVLAEQAPIDTVDAERYRSAIGVAIRRVFLQLSPEDRNLLRLHHLEGVSLDRLALMNRVHRATIARRLAELRQRVYEETRREVGVAHRITKSEFRSLFRRIQSSLDAFEILTESPESVLRYPGKVDRSG